MTLENAIELIKQEYEKASDSNYVHNPLAYALYQVWKKADRQIIIEPKDTDLKDKCGSCKWAMPIKGSTKGVFGSYVVCQNPLKAWKHDVSSRRQRTTPKCKLYQQKTEAECPDCKHFVSCEPSTTGICDEFEEDRQNE